MAAQRGGGVLIDAGGQFFMNGGTIGSDVPGDGNTASGQNAAGGVLVADGSVTMVDGKIQFNSTQDNVSGGGVLVANGSFYMLDGIIQENTVSGSLSGGGVLVTNGSFTISDGIIQENTASGSLSGGGVLVTGGSFNMVDGKIQFNHTQDVISGGGVLICTGSFNMSGGTITENTTGNPNNYGVYISGTLYYSDPLPSFIMSGSAEITQDNMVFLANFRDGFGFYMSIAIGGDLSVSPAANIIHESPSAGTTYLLQASSPALIEDNYDKFLYNGDWNRIKGNPATKEAYRNIWYGLYQ
jgi:hypothetical protein